MVVVKCLLIKFFFLLEMTAISRHVRSFTSKSDSLKNSTSHLSLFIVRFSVRVAGAAARDYAAAPTPHFAVLHHPYHFAWVKSQVIYPRSSM